eukprot:TRINITY_DN7760_c0_g1_i3.p1 TRINITY_DN7760_c0_g1~~TRINITY_DN7760_c0_g1_i3.p1  ORF type:complete len:335 (+),score=57.12 TRINITY_DN7760_c0_g1_i3:116-1120(+)
MNEDEVILSKIILLQQNGKIPTPAVLRRHLGRIPLSELTRLSSRALQLLPSVTKLELEKLKAGQEELKLKQLENEFENLKKQRQELKHQTEQELLKIQQNCMALDQDIKSIEAQCIPLRRKKKELEDSRRRFLITGMVAPGKTIPPRKVWSPPQYTPQPTSPPTSHILSELEVYECYNPEFVPSSYAFVNAGLTILNGCPIDKFTCEQLSKFLLPEDVFVVNIDSSIELFDELELKEPEPRSVDRNEIYLSVSDLNDEAAPCFGVFQNLSGECKATVVVPSTDVFIIFWFQGYEQKLLKTSKAGDVVKTLLDCFVGSTLAETAVFMYRLGKKSP